MLPCAICGEHKSQMHIDHKKGTKGRFRGVLCQSCNNRLGWFENRTEEIWTYLKENGDG